MTATTKQDDARAETAEGGGSANMVTVSRADIARGLQSPYATPSALQTVGAQLQLSSAQIARLVGGQSDLQMTAEQYASLRDSLAAAYAEAGKDQQNPQRDQRGSLCGSSGSPAPSQTAQPNRVPSVTTTTSGVTETDPGTQLSQGTVGGGTVTVRRDVVASGFGANLFAISYQGSDASDAHWLQFIHREVIGIHADGSAHPLAGSFATNANPYNLTPGGTATSYGTPTRDNYNTDAGTNGGDPFYETVGAANRAADQTTIYDRPSGGGGKINAAFAAGAQRVISRAHFDTFLIQTDHVTYRVRLTITYDYSSSTVTPTPTTVLNGSGQATALPDAIRERFHSDWPAYNWLR